MTTLSSSQRNKLEKIIVRARLAAEKGAYHALEAFAVHYHEPYAHMSPEDRELRRSLRIRARLLGDRLNGESHSIDHLAYELAYESWHQMLFARFLEFNHLLIHPDYGIPVSLEECEELSKEEGYVNKWEAASYYASRMLPAIFRPDHPLMQIRYATEDRIALEELLEDIDSEILSADDSLGWVYQFWQSAAKEAANAEGGKVEAEDLPAVTQLFTEPYMVQFLIDNTLGAWWTAKNPDTTSPIPFHYLRPGEDGSPAAGSFEGWPQTWSEITMMDPCMGSGHIIVEVFRVMATLRMHDQCLSKEEACDAVIRENIHGLELDDRCTQIAAFNLALAAWKFCGKYRELPPMNLACSGTAPHGKVEDWMRLANHVSDSSKRNLYREGLKRMYELFQDAPKLGSLIDPTQLGDVFSAGFEELSPFLEQLAEEEQNEEEYERGIIAAGIAKAGLLLARRYVWHITNVPYLARGKQNKFLQDFCENNYPDSKNELATVMFEKMLSNNKAGGTSCAVIPQNWLFLTTYSSFRESFLNRYQWDIVARLGIKAFRTPMWDFNVMLLSISNEKSSLQHQFSGLDVSEYESAEEKEAHLGSASIHNISQNKQLGNPDHRIVFKTSPGTDLFSRFISSYQGIATGDYNRYGRYFFEIQKIDKRIWIYQQSTVKETVNFSGKSNVLFWEDGEGSLCNFPNARIQGLAAMNSFGVAVSQMGSLSSTLSTGTVFDNNCAVLIPKNIEHLPAIWCFCSSPEYSQEVRKIDQKLNVTNATLAKVPFDLEYWQMVAEAKYPNGLPQPYSDDPTQWLFHGHPYHSDHPLQVVIARLMGYRWPAEEDKEMELDPAAREKIRQIHELALPIDDDGIVCIPSVNGEAPAAERVREQIMEIWGSEYSGNTLRELITREGSKKRDLAIYLRDDFFKDHIKLFNRRPFIWQIWDGRKDGFSALVNYHLLTRANLEKLIYTYLGDWIHQCERKVENQVSGAEGQLYAAKELKEKLLLILEGEPPYDLFIRWKSLEEQPIGWEPDINDGVRMNIYPFVEAGILRRTFSVKWGKDRGKNPAGSSWGPHRYNRYEDLEEEWKLKDESGKVTEHLTTALKRSAREKVDK